MFLSWDPILEADMERAETYEKMVDTEKAKKLGIISRNILIIIILTN